MKSRTLLVVFSLAVMPFTAVAQGTRVNARGAEVAPPSLQRILAGTAPQDGKEISGLLAFKPEIPLGPADVLRGYENEMTMVTQRMSAGLAGISQAVRSGEITPGQAEYLIQERYQVAMMQYQVFSALHDVLEQDIAEAGRLPKGSQGAASDTTVVVKTPFARSSQGQ